MHAARLDPGQSPCTPTATPEFFWKAASPYRCVCLPGVNGTLTVRFHAPQSDNVELVISGIVREDWATITAANALVEELRRELRAALSDDD